MKVLALTRYGPLGASSRIRCYQYVSSLRELGVDVDVVELLKDDYVRGLQAGGQPPVWTLARWYAARLKNLLASRRYDLLWIAHEIYPGLPATFERVFARTGPPYVVELDDALFHRYDLLGSRLRRAVLGHKIDVVMAKSAMVIAGNEYLAARARSAGAARIELLPSVVDARRYPVLPIHGRRFTIGWIGSPTTASYLGLIKGALKRAHERGARLIAVGAPKEALPDLPFELRRWDEATEANEVSHFDVGIMPLSDGPWERGKCGYKLIQYMACGRPVIASAVGANLTIVEPGVSGWLARQESDWTTAFDALAADPDLRVRMGQAGRRAVERRFSVQANAPVLAKLLKDAAG